MSYPGVHHLFLVVVSVLQCYKTDIVNSRVGILTLYQLRFDALYCQTKSEICFTAGSLKNTNIHHMDKINRQDFHNHTHTLNI